MVYYDPQTRQKKDLLTGVHARTFWGENLMLAVVDLDANAVIPPHRHVHEQGGIILEGEIEFTVAGEARRLHPGDLYIIPGDVEHSARVGAQPAKVMDIFSPVRQEYKY